MSYNVIDNFRYTSNVNPNFERDAYDSLVAANAAAVRGDLEPGHLIYIRGSELTEETKGEGKTFKYWGLGEDGTGIFTEFGSVDTELSEDSDNPVSGKVVLSALSEKQDKIDTVLNINGTDYKVGDSVEIDTSIDVDTELDPTSDNPISNSAVTAQINRLAPRDHTHDINDITGFEFSDLNLDDLKAKISKDDLRLNGECIKLELEDESIDSILSHLSSPETFDTFKVYVNNKYRGLISNSEYGTVLILDDSIFNWEIDSTLIGEHSNTIKVGDTYWSMYSNEGEYPLFTWASTSEVTNGDYEFDNTGKYNSDDKLVTLESSNDVIKTLYGSNWRIPTKSEAEKFINNLEVSINNDLVHIVSNSGDVIEVNFSPLYTAPGYYLNNNNLYFWTSSIDEDDLSKAWAIKLTANSDGVTEFSLVSIPREYAIPVLGMFSKSWVKLRTITDSVLNGTSTNPIQNKAVYNRINEIISDENTNTTSTWSSNKISNYIENNSSIKRRIEVGDVNDIADPDPNTIYLIRLPEEERTQNNEYDEFLYVYIDEVDPETGTSYKRGVFERIGSSGNKQAENELAERIARLESYHVSFSYSASHGTSGNLSSAPTDYHRLYYLSNNNRYYVRTFYVRNANCTYKNNGELVETVSRNITKAELTLNGVKYTNRNSSGVFCDTNGKVIEDIIGSGSGQVNSYNTSHTASISWTCEPHASDNSGKNNSGGSGFNISINYPKLIMFLGDGNINESNIATILKNITGTSLNEKVISDGNVTANVIVLNYDYSKTSITGEGSSPTLNKSFTTSMSLFIASSDPTYTSATSTIVTTVGPEVQQLTDITNSSTVLVSNHSWRVWKTNKSINSASNYRWEVTLIK